jgi:hypothetical protein
LLPRDATKVRLPEPSVVDGVHALYYGPAPGALAAAVRAALADPSRLARIAEAGRVRVLENHTHAAVCRTVLESLRGAATT